MTSKREWNLTRVRTSKTTASAVSTDYGISRIDRFILTDPTEPRLKEETQALVPRYGADVARFNKTLEDTSAERHRKMSTEVLGDKFEIELDE
jgi:hypothetical protein